MIAPGVIEIDIRELDGRGMFAAIDGAVTGAPAKTLLRIKVGSTMPPAWLPWLQYPLNWQFVADNAQVLTEWQHAARQEVNA